MFLRRWLAVVVLLAFPAGLLAHPLVENAIDVVIYPDRIIVDARISAEEIQIIEAESDARPTADAFRKLATQHQPYVLAHLKFHADGDALHGKAAAEPVVSSEDLSRASYRFEFPLKKPPQTVRIDQDLLREKQSWQCSCIVRVRRLDIDVFQSVLLTGGRYIEFDCDWGKNVPSTSPTTNPSASNTGSIRTEVRPWPTIRAYTEHGIRHILTGLDHLLFVSALVLAARGIWDLVKVVTAFTIAHTLTLTLSVLNIVTLSSRIVEPMIAASIFFVALQNVFWPRQSRGWSRLAVAFAFGLFHGLGFAGGLKQAMSEMPMLALGLALAAFSLGVEIGHQMVVIPLFVFLKSVRKSPVPEGRVFKLGSAAISLAGLYFLFQAIR